jgi:radical SAM superfamily enzyme YgiQ (UPF0313 family)
MRSVDPLADLGGALRRVEKPARYVGGEFGAVRDEGARDLTVAVSYPDLYEIGMSNSAVRILYNLLNAVDGVRCERVFAVAPDFEAELRSRGIPLYALESGRALADFDILAFSVGYELTLTNLLAILDLGGIPLRAAERGEDGPVVMAGGPACTNPVPLGVFADCVFIGEAEGWAAEAFPRMAGIKAKGGRRSDLLEFLRSQASIWHPGKRETVRRALWRGFAVDPARTCWPVPSLRIVQDHGTVEIMRGCPNACRFCHAACYYRPTRLKETAAIEAETRALVEAAGYREVTLSSLSTGDFRDVHGLVKGLNARYASRRVSFSLPSLRVDSLALALLKEISEVRKSGLTFAVETALPEWQREIGKSAPLDKTVDILREARSLGWRSAKFYFMVGLPASFSEDEAGPIVAFLREVREATRMTIHANVAAFIPKPHTPYQRAAQLREKPALERIMAVKSGIPRDGFKIGYHAPILSLLEGMISRGDERAALLVLEAYRAGARLDAWEEHLKLDVWRSVIAGAGWDVEEATCRERGPAEELPWDGVSLRLSESEVSETPAKPLPAPPSPPSEGMPVETSGHEPREPSGVKPPPPPRALFSFTKHGTASYLSHLDLLSVFERSLARAGCPVSFSEGFNPKPRLEFASPLGVGVDSEEEIASIELTAWDSGAAFLSALNRSLPPGLEVTRVELMGRTATGKKPSLMAAFWGSEYRVCPPDTLPAPAEGSGVVEVSRTPGAVVLRLPAGGQSKELLRAVRGREGSSVLRTRTLAADAEGRGVSYFELFCSSALI